MLDSKLCTARALDHMHSISGDSMGSGQSQNEEEPSEEKPKVNKILYCINFELFRTNHRSI